MLFLIFFHCYHFVFFKKKKKKTFFEILFLRSIRRDRYLQIMNKYHRQTFGIVVKKKLCQSLGEFPTDVSFTAPTLWELSKTLENVCSRLMSVFQKAKMFIRFVTLLWNFYLCNVIVIKESIKTIYLAFPSL